MDHLLKFKYLVCVVNELGTNEAECRRKVASGRRVADAIRSLVNGRDLQLEFARFLHKTLLIHVLMYDCETLIWREKEGSRIRAVQMEKLSFVK